MGNAKRSELERENVEKTDAVQLFWVEHVCAVKDCSLPKLQFLKATTICSSPWVLKDEN